MKKIVVSLIFIFSSLLSFSSHFMGGEITWKCIKGGPNIGQYIFEMKVYRDCDGITFSQTSQTLTHHNYPALGTTFEAGGRAGYMGGGITGIRKPNAIAPTGGPMHQGLRSLYINDKDY